MRTPTTERLHAAGVLNIHLFNMAAALYVVSDIFLGGTLNGVLAVFLGASFLYGCGSAAFFIGQHIRAKRHAARTPPQ